MKLFGYWTVLVALTISAVAAYYSIVGLVAIFAAAMVPIIIMGAVLEVGKLTTAVWLHAYWDKAKWHVKSYLSIALVLLMFITSMGIFGFLSKAHIEQTAQATEGVAQLERIETQIVRAEEVIARAEAKIQKLENTNTDVDAGLEEKIAREQERIDTAYDRIQPAIDEQKQLLVSNLAPYETQLEDINNKLSLLQQYADSNEVKALQRLVGARADGQYGSGTAKKADAFRADNEQKRDQVLYRMQGLRDDSTSAINRLRGIAEGEIADSNKLISRLREQVGVDDNSEQIAIDIAEQRAKIKESEVEIESLYEKKYAIEGEARKLEAEVGPVKYIAEMVYGENADANTLEAAVRWVILILVVVFDPLAVVLIIAGITLIENSRPKIKKTEPLLEELEAKAEELQEEIVELKEEMNDLEAGVEIDIPEFNMEEHTTPIINEVPHEEYSEWEALSEETLKEIQDEEEQRQPEQNSASESQNVESVGEEEVRESSEDTPEDNQENTSIEEEVVYEDIQGKYTINEHGHKSYIIDELQYELNKKAKQSKKQSQVDATIDRMKADGYWPNVNMTADVEELLANADPDTLEEVYKEITKDLNQKKEI